MKRTLTVFVTVILIAFALAAAGTPAVAQITRARVTGGTVAGTVADGLSEFKGIPFAAPPVGALRWKAPQPLAPWHGIRQTTAFAPACMQNAGATSQAPATPLSEDCLYLNVWTPAKTSREKLPVIAWIYGGGFSGGSTSAPLYDGTHFAQKGVVFVSISYRVNAFGFLATPELSRESGHGSGAYGLLDQIAGLEWIRANVAKFGGDPSKVTLLGHSAGGFSVSMLAASPVAKGLFRAVISESGANFTPPQDSPWGGASIETLRMSEAAGEAWLKSLGASTLEEARALPAEKILAAERAPGAPRFWPPVDGYAVTGDQYDLWHHGQFNDTPILVGDVSDEAAGFGVRKTDPRAFEASVRSGYGKEADAILAVYPHATDEQATRAATELRSDTTFDWGQYTWARLESSCGKHNAYVYYYDRPSARDPNGSGHGSEVAYVFGNLGGPNRPAPTADDLAISQEMQSYWINFATTGDPNGAGLPSWPAFTEGAPLVMRFGVNPGPAPIPNQDRLKVLDTYYTWRRAGSN
ncbi:MAG TPA: carboxylesterase family protein [Candidatus Acidoferrales bacterium]|nr:carboxylesterase family protein [Candidatus Acidoferrales bacterium]